jgi:hypothetical protein
MKGSLHPHVHDRRAARDGGSTAEMPVLPARLASELSNQFEAALAFADYCAYVTEGRMAVPAEQLVELADQIYAATRADLLDDRHRT